MRDSHGVAAVGTFGELLDKILQKATNIKQSSTIEPPLLKADLDDVLPQIDQIEGLERPTTAPQDGSNESDKEREKRSMRYAIIETAIRDTFNDLLASYSINSPEFVAVWNLLDVVAILSDNEQCDPALMFWLVEELLDSQTIDGCRKVFDYLESRRERITTNHFKQKSLVILRSCNELLRRLSRAEDTAFCGRVFIFLFQSFPLGDKSSVNLRGEYHVENVTTFDQATEDSGAMDVDTPQGDAADQPKEIENDIKKTVSFDSRKGAPEPTMTPGELYPIFWSLQQSFSQPKRLFDREHFGQFKSGLEATVSMFKAVKAESNRRSGGNDESKKGTKRKRTQDGDDLANTFNPKYLTSRDLFELEISDLSFRRHVLVQALIVMEFLLSLSSKAKQKLSTVTTQNKSVMYQDQLLDEEDVKWAQDMKGSIADYLKRGSEGPFFYRMVETVLSRDKNWVRWKVENCPPIARPPISPESYASAKDEINKTTANKKIRPKPMGSLDLGFMTHPAGSEGLKDPARSAVPDVKTFKNKIALDEMDMEMATDDEKSRLSESIASKRWRALRIARTSKLAMFDKIDDAEKIDLIFEDHVEDEEDNKDEEDSGEGEDAVLPTDQRPVVIFGPVGVGKTSVIDLLLEKEAKVFKKIARHTNRPRDGDAKDYQYVSVETFNMLRDGDVFLEYNEVDGHDYGTSRRAIEEAGTSGKVAIVELDSAGVRQFKDNAFDARFILVLPQSTAQLEQQLQERGQETEEKIGTQVKAAEAEVNEIQELADKVITNQNLEGTVKELSAFIFGTENPQESTNGEQTQENGTEPAQADVMETDPPQQPQSPAKQPDPPQPEPPKYSRIEVVDMSR